MPTELDQVKLENRLSKLEALGTSIQSEVKRIADQFMLMNGSVRENTRWRTEHDHSHALARAAAEAVSVTRKRDLGYIIAALTAVWTVSSTLGIFALKLIGVI